MKIPNRVTLTKTSTNKLQTIKNRTGITPNISSRIAIMLAINSNDDLSVAGAGTGDAKGQILDKDTLFGDHIDVYEIIIRQYINDNEIELPISAVITSLVEVGIHKMGHVRSLEQLCSLS